MENPSASPIEVSSSPRPALSSLPDPGSPQQHSLPPEKIPTQHELHEIRQLMLISPEDFLATYRASLSMNILQQFCQDQRNLGDRLPIVKHILSTTHHSIDVNDETFERVMQTSYRLRNRPDAIPEVRRYQHEFTRDDLDELQDMPATISTTITAQASTSESKPMPHIMTNKKEVTFLPPQIQYEEQRDETRSKVIFSELSHAQQIAVQDQLIVHLCHRLQAYTTEQQYKNYMDSLFFETGLTPHPYSEKRGGKLLEEIIQNAQKSVIKPLYEQPLPVSQTNTQNPPQSPQILPPQSFDIQTNYKPVVINRARPYLSAFHYLCANTGVIPDRYEVLEFLLTLGASPNGYRENNFTPLYDLIINPAIPSMEDRCKLIKLLLQYHATTSDLDGSKNTIFHLLINAPHLNLAGKKRIFSLLRDYGANINIANHNQHSPLELLCFGYYSMNPYVQALFLPVPPQPKKDGESNDDYDTIVMTQTTQALQHPGKIPYHLLSSAHTKQTGLQPISVTSCRLYPQTYDDRVELAQFLLNMGHSVTGMSPGTTLLHQLVSTYYPARLLYIDMLLRNSVPVNDLSPSGDTPLHALLAGHHDTIAIIQFLKRKQIQYEQEILLNGPKAQLFDATQPHGKERSTAAGLVISNSYHQNSNKQNTLSIPQNCIDLLTQVFTPCDSRTSFTDDELIRMLDDRQEMERRLVFTYFPEYITSELPTVVLDDGLLICQLLILFGASPFIRNKDEFLPIARHYFVLRGVLALSRHLSEHFAKLLALENLLPSSPAEQGGSPGATTKTLPSELPLTNWMAKQQKAIRRRFDSESAHDPLIFDDPDFESVSSHFDTYKSIHEELGPDISITRHEIPVLMNNEMPIMKGSQRSLLQPQHYERDNTNRIRHDRLDSNTRIAMVAQDLHFVAPTIDLPTRKPNLLHKLE